MLIWQVTGGQWKLELFSRLPGNCDMLRMKLLLNFTFEWLVISARDTKSGYISSQRQLVRMSRVEFKVLSIFRDRIISLFATSSKLYRIKITQHTQERCEKKKSLSRLWRRKFVSNRVQKPSVRLNWLNQKSNMYFFVYLYEIWFHHQQMNICYNIQIRNEISPILFFLSRFSFEKWSDSIMHNHPLASILFAPN